MEGSFTYNESPYQSNQHSSKRPPSRRTSRVQNPEVECSPTSILGAMDRFVKSVQDLDSTVMLSSKLRDLDVEGGKTPEPVKTAIDLVAFHDMLSTAKNQLIWGVNSDRTSQPSVGSKLFQKPSVRSAARATHRSSLTESESDSDSGCDDRLNGMAANVSALPIEAQLSHHLNGLHTVLEQLTICSDFLSERYQQQIE